MNYDALLKFGKKTIDQIELLVKNQEFDKAYELIWNTEQPEKWIKSEKSDLVKLSGEYNFNEIGLIENLGKKIFQVFEFEIQSFSRVQDRSKFSSNVLCVLHHAFKGEKPIHNKSGIASVASGSHYHLSISDPMAFSNSKKSAARELGAFFGKNLNRTLENLDFIPTIQVEKGESITPSDEEYEKIVTAIKSSEYREEALDHLENSGNYKMGLKYKPEIVNAINAKPLKNNNNGQNKESTIIGS